ncbi:type I restriction endonuclease subunit R [Pseudorhodoferax sp. Leaf274]|uniref:type I restriction endonuclease subunit R n=1 Tax=Pseudorhodoferax sp. Leaf274 TaxID=1736318 RepID=UPI0007030052|nr:HsdR family type I site-specific deoxyribonuclease [Pseudorhodoferax sp. Leaf274]KQP43378.1 deoxyribonuclease HsdR [Pseudorhodoferax sp. Leaf274]
MSEYTEVEQPFLAQLAAQGWTVIDQGPQLPQAADASLRTSFRPWWLPGVFREAVRALNTLPDGMPWLADRQLDELESALFRQPQRTLLEANLVVHELLIKTQVDVNEATGEVDPVVRLIDFQHPERNRFHAVNQFRIDTPGCVRGFIVPDIVLFVNGIPLVVVECKKGSATCANPMQEAFVQLQRYMRRRPETEAAGLKEGEPRLFRSNLLLVRSSGAEADYGSISSEAEHFYAWKTLYPADDVGAEALSPQQRLVAGMLVPANLLQIARTCTVFMDTDAGTRVKVVCRYQQFRAAGKIVQRLRSGQTAAERSGVVWHTQGSGKSLTMVFVARMLRASTDLNDHKIVLVNDRQDLEEQLGETATLIGGRVNVIGSTQALRQHLASDSSDINMVMVHKFQEREQALSPMVAEALGTYLAMPAGKTFGVVNRSERIVLMIDEAHRTQGSDLGENLFEAFPNAVRLAFTGTPLLTERHGERKTVKRFGEYIDTYKLMDAVHDGATLQILYEGRTADSALNEKHAFDQKFEDLFRDRSEEELAAIRKKYGATGDILEAEARINAIARDLVAHYVDNILPNGFKAQVVCHSKLACVRYRNGIRAAIAERLALEQARPAPDAALVRKLGLLQAVVVVSSDGTNEAAYITHARREAARLNAVQNFCKGFDLDDPDQANTGIAFLIVCDMLLTGFDAPIEQVMYIDKRLREHTLLQAIARTNRVKRGKRRGYVVDYIGLANHLAEALSLYTASDELEELREGLKNIGTELPVLEERHQRLLQHFEAKGVAGIQAFVSGALLSQAQEAAVVHAAVKSLVDERYRADFEVYLKKFLMSLDIVLPHVSAQPFRVPAKRFGYILQVAKERYKDDSLDLGDAGEKVKALINEHLVSLGINPKLPPVELLAQDFLQRLQQHAGDNDEARASEMEHAIRKHCTVHHDEDPAFYQRLSEKVDALIERHQGAWDALVDQLDALRSEAVAGRQDGVHGLGREASSFFEHLVQVAYGAEPVPATDLPAFKRLVEQLVELLQQTIGSIDFWQNADKQKRLRGEIKQAISRTGPQAAVAQRERLAVEVMKLARNRHDGLLQAGRHER